MDLVQQSQLFIFPTTYEAMAATLLEVAALDTPLIASDIPENREVLPDQALFFRSGDVADLREKMKWAIANPGQMALLAKKARNWVADNYRWPTVIARYEDLYDQLTNGDAAANATANQLAGPDQRIG